MTPGVLTAIAQANPVTQTKTGNTNLTMLLESRDLWQMNWWVGGGGREEKSGGALVADGEQAEYGGGLSW